MNRLRCGVLVVTMLFASGSALAVAVGGEAPSFTLPNAAGRPIDLVALRGKFVYVDFWASWCPPCRRSFPWMNEMTRKYGPQGLTIVAINVDKKREDADKFLKQTPAEFTVVYDPTGSAPAAWEVMAMPTSFLVDSNGKVVFVESGFKEERTGGIEERIRQALGVR